MSISIVDKVADPYAGSKHNARERNKMAYAKTSNNARNEKRSVRGFIGVDGEGIRTRCEKSGCTCTLFTGSKASCETCRHAEDAHYHAYVLLGVGNQYISTQTLGVEEIGWEEAFDFMYREFLKPANRYKVFCGFFLGYDFTEIFKSLPERTAWKLYNSHGNLHDASERKGKDDDRPVSSRKPTIYSRECGKGKPWPVRITGKRGAWEFDTLDERQLRLRPFNCGCADPEYHAQFCTWDRCSHDHHLATELRDDGSVKAHRCHWKDKTIPEPEWLYVSDVGSFFQTSFLKVIDPVEWFDKDCSQCVAQECMKHGSVTCKECKKPACPDHSIVTREEYDLIAKGKERRDTAQLDAEMIDYNQRENLLLSKVMSKYQEGLLHFGINLRIDQWYGPGQAAGKWIEHQGKEASCTSGKKREDNPFYHLKPETQLEILVDRAARASYIAGWFEIFAHGHVPGTTWEYDINSAYPSVIKDLPCLAHGKWEAGFSGGTKLRPLPKGAMFRLVHATVTGSDPHMGAMLHRDADFNISRPHSSHSWYWQDELEAAQAAGLIDTIEIGCNEEACLQEYKYGSALTLTFYPNEDRCGKPLHGMEDLYQERINLGKNTPMGKAAKLVYNSAYGKFAQLVGSPIWASNIYASRITSGCRKMILDAIADHPEGTKAVVMIATDGVYFRSRMPEEWRAKNVSPKELGKWDEDSKENLTLFKPGVYWDDKARARIAKGEAPEFKSRGVSAKRFASQLAKIDEVFRSWNGKFPDDESSWPTVRFPAGFQQTSCKQALMRGKWSDAGKVTTSGFLAQNSFPDGKRAYTEVVAGNGDITKAALRIIGEYDSEYGLYRSKPIVQAYIVSVPRSEEQTSARKRDNFDDLEYITPDEGSVSTQIVRVVGMKD